MKRSTLLTAQGWRGGFALPAAAGLAALVGLVVLGQQAATPQNTELQPNVTTALAQANLRTLNSEQMRTIQANTINPRSVALMAAVKDYTGPFSLEDIGAQIASVIDEMIRQGQDYAWNNFRPVSIVVLYSDPTGKDQVKMGIGITVPSKLELKEPLRFEQFKFRNAVRHVHRGPLQQLDLVFRGVDKNLRSKAKSEGAGWPVVLQILDDPRRIEPQQLRTVINIPAK